MKIPMQILLLMRFVYSLKAEEDANLAESRVSFEDYSSIELAVLTPEVITETEKKLDRDNAYLKDPFMDEVYKAAKISMQYKDSSTEKEENKKPVESKIYTDDADFSQGLKHKNLTETNNSDSNVHNHTLNEKNRSDTPQSKNFNEKSKNILKQDDQNLDSEVVQNSFEPVLVKPTRKSSTTDDMDDLIFREDLEKSTKSYDGDDFDRSLYPETQIASDLDELDQDFRPSRRMFDFVPILDSNGRFEDVDHLEPIKTHRPSLGPGSNPSNLAELLLPNRPNYYEKPNIRFFNDPNHGYHFPTKWGPEIPSNQRAFKVSSQEILINPNKFETYEDVENDPIRFDDSREILKMNSRETLFGLNQFHNAEEIVEYIPDKYGMSQEILYNPNSMIQEYPKISVHNRMVQPLRTYNLPNKWLGYMTLIPNRWIKVPELQNNPVRWVHPRTLNIPNAFNPSISDPRIMQSQETYDLQDFEKNAIQTAKYYTLDSNVYPYVSSKTGKTDDSNTNPLFRQLAQSSYIPHPQLPIYSILRNPGYRPFDPWLIGRSNLALVPRFRRFSLGNNFQFNRRCCY